MLARHHKLGSRRAFLARVAGGVGLLSITASDRRSSGANTSTSTSVDDVPWLSEVQQPPKIASTDAESLPSVLTKSDGTPVTTLAEWKTERQKIRSRWLEFLGPMPIDRPPLRLVVR